MRLAKSIVFLVAVATAGPALAEPPPTVVVLRGSSAPPQPWGGPPAAQAYSAPQAPTATYGDPTYAPVYYFLPGYFQTPPRRAGRYVPPPPQAAPAHPIKPWGVGLAPFQR